MSSDHPRPVWLTGHQRDFIEGLSSQSRMLHDFLAPIVVAWDAAPADAAEAVKAAMPTDDGYGYEHVLRALGWEQRDA